VMGQIGVADLKDLGPDWLHRDDAEERRNRPGV